MVLGEVDSSSLPSTSEAMCIDEELMSESGTGMSNGS
jgi:hypothetical protein